MHPNEMSTMHMGTRITTTFSFLSFSSIIIYGPILLCRSVCEILSFLFQYPLLLLFLCYVLISKRLQYHSLFVEHIVAVALDDTNITCSRSRWNTIIISSWPYVLILLLLHITDSIIIVIHTLPILHYSVWKYFKCVSGGQLAFEHIEFILF